MHQFIWHLLNKGALMWACYPSRVSHSHEIVGERYYIRSYQWMMLRVQIFVVKLNTVHHFVINWPLCK